MTKPTFAGAFVLGFLLLATTAQADDIAAHGFPLEIENCGAMLTIAAPPTRAIGLGQNSTEIMLLLGLEDRMAGSAIWVSPVLPELAEANAKVHHIADSMPGFEAVVGLEPDLLAVQFQSSVGPDGRVGTPEQFADLGIPTYVSPSNCGTGTKGNGDGSRAALYSNALLYQEVEDLARIFGVHARGVELVASLKAREAAARARSEKLTGDVSVLYWFSSAEVAGDAWVAGRNGAPAYINATLGTKNVVDTDEDWPLVGWETIAAADPTVIVIGTMDRRTQPADDPEVKKAFLAADPVASELTAVREGRIVEMDAQAMNPTLRTIQGLEVMADALETFGLLM